jgi:hypothetical protein
VVIQALRQQCQKFVRKRIYAETRIQDHYGILFMTAFDEYLKEFSENDDE